MHFVVTCLDKDGGLETRKANREAHLAYLGEHSASILVAGPLLDDEGSMMGSSLICEAEDKAALEAILAKDPYAKAGLFKDVSIRGWKWVVGAPS
ncbi:YciI family protein [uncultured Cohaesibacter sp.]|uniref:YciI family protein n=1 Tax=uncultured Cohaesibacter sp. TaxID=1002546 RepID=UPI0029C905EA|nr:YciI family protein [uncultured Cohaesibacter sp.]